MGKGKKSVRKKDTGQKGFDSGMESSSCDTIEPPIFETHQVIDNMSVRNQECNAKPSSVTGHGANQVFDERSERAIENLLQTNDASSLDALKAFDIMPERKQPVITSPSVSFTLGTEDTKSVSIEDCDSSVGEEDVDHGKEENLCPVVAPTKPSWSSLFENSRDPSTGLVLAKQTHFIEESCKLTSEDCVPLQKACGFSAIGYIAGRFPGKKALMEECRKWGVPFQYSVHPTGLLIFKFETLEGLEKVLYGGPYFVYQRPLLLKRMPEFFAFGNEEITKIPVWVKLHNLPLQLWTQSALSKILSLVGTPIRTDKVTAEFGSFAYARALVEVDVSKDLVNTVNFVLPHGTPFEQHIVYESRPRFCKNCNMIGHSTTNCNTNNNNLVVKTDHHKAGSDPLEKQINEGPANPELRQVVHDDKQLVNSEVEINKQPRGNSEVVHLVEPGPSNQNIHNQDCVGVDGLVDKNPIQVGEEDGFTRKKPKNKKKVMAVAVLNQSHSSTHKSNTQLNHAHGSTHKNITGKKGDISQPFVGEPPPAQFHDNCFLKYKGL